MNTSPAVLRHAQTRLVQSWFATLIVYAAYCYLHNVVMDQRVDGAGAALAEWAIWLALAPAVTVVVALLSRVDIVVKLVGA